MLTPSLMCARSRTLILIILHLLGAAQERAASHTRLIFPRKFWNIEEGGGIAMETTIRPPAAVQDVLRERRLAWRDLDHKEHLLSNSHTCLSQTLVPETQKRRRRHVLLGSRGHVHGQLMRVGCVLGTCQVQNLSHRLYQLIGQRRREHSSPVNPRSPHSYG
ncbi:uncharacterized protein adm2b isoform X1 [Tachysurus fulvidraco]|uniref:uncharacterized protein adm2b isoform X1 n=1 Tax=Tachysurus fulvidraco TaxID=1234273 RepID=UPI001FF07665|nr:uncharacterized protein adm2b isoform X1 [Tachysurus fulvidraco]XP_047678009.1 uncharacterized protein adm2b isoform X1 [Tachysurus fulvidraco]